MLVRVLVSVTPGCAQFGADSVRIYAGLVLLGLTPASGVVSSVPVVPFIATCVVVGSERTRGPAPLQAREMLWNAHGIFMSWLVPPSVLSVGTSSAVWETGQPGPTAGRRNRRKRKQGN